MFIDSCHIHCCSLTILHQIEWNDKSIIISIKHDMQDARFYKQLDAETCGHYL